MQVTTWTFFLKFLATPCDMFPNQESDLLPHIERRSLNHWTTRKVPNLDF